MSEPSATPLYLFREKNRLSTYRHFGLLSPHECLLIVAPAPVFITHLLQHLDQGQLPLLTHFRVSRLRLPLTRRFRHLNVNDLSVLQKLTSDPRIHALRL